MDDERPQESEDETSNNSQHEEELDQVLSAASSLVESLAEEVGTPDELDVTPPPSDPTGESESDAPDFMSELTQEASPSSSGPTSIPDTNPEGSHLGAGSSTVASPENLGVIGSNNIGVIGTAATAIQDDILEEELNATEATQLADENDENAESNGMSIIPTVLSVLGSFGVWMMHVVAPLLEVLDRPVRGVSPPIRHAMGILALATLATAMVVLALSFW